MKFLCLFEGDPFSEDITQVYKFHNAVPTNLLTPPNAEVAEQAARILQESNHPKIELLTDWVREASDHYLAAQNTGAARRTNFCFDASVMAVYAGRKAKIDISVYQVEQIHKTVGLSYSAASAHVLAVAKDNKRYYGIDDTYTQFVRFTDGELVKGKEEKPLGKNIYDPQVFPLVDLLFRKGYFLMTPENLLAT